MRFVKFFLSIHSSLTVIQALTGKVYPLIKQGRSKKGYEAPVSTIGLDGDRVYGDVYLNALGYLIAAGDLSYSNQQKHIICHSEDFLNYLKSTQIKNKRK